MSRETFHDLLARLDEDVRELADEMARIGAGLPVELESTMTRLNRAAEAGEAVRRLITGVAATIGVETPSWSTRAELEPMWQGLVTAQERASHSTLRRRLIEVANELELGTVSHRLDVRRQGLDELRKRTIDELRAAAELVPPPELPEAPTDVPFVSWAVALKDPHASKLASEMPVELPELAELLAELDEHRWVPPQAAVRSGAEADVGEERNSVGSSAAEPDAEARGSSHPVPEIDSGVMVAVPVSGLVDDGKRSASDVLTDHSRGPRDSLVAGDVGGLAQVEDDRETGPIPKSPQSSRTAEFEQDSAFQHSKPDSSSESSEPALPALDSKNQVPSPPQPSLEPSEEESGTRLTYAEYTEKFWLNPRSGEVEPVPWLTATFSGELDRATLIALRERRLADLWLLARAAELVDLAPTFAPPDIEAIAAVRASPRSHAAGWVDDRARMLLEALESGEVGPGPRWKLAALLEAIRPSGGFRYETPTHLCEALDFTDHRIRSVLQYLLQANTNGTDGLSQLRESLENRPQRSVAELTQDLASKRTRLHAKFVELRSAAGRKVQRTHCREAWDKFIRDVLPTLKSAFPETHDGAKLPAELVALRADALGISRRHAEVADADGVRYQDRTAMDRAAAALADALLEVVDAAELCELRKRPRRDSAMHLVPPIAELHALQNGPATDVVEEFLREVLVELVWLPEISQRPGDLHLTLQDIAEQPALVAELRHVSGQELRQAPWQRAVVRVFDVSRPVRVAAILMSQRSSVSTEASQPTEVVKGRLRDIGRSDLLARIADGEGTTDPAQEHRRLDSAWQDVDIQLGDLRRLAAMLEDLASAGRNWVMSRVDEVEKLRRATGEDGWPTVDLPLLLHWLALVTREADRQRQEAVAALRARFVAPDEHVRAQFELAANEGRWTEALRLAGERVPRGAHRARETEWRNFKSGEALATSWADDLISAEEHKGTKDILARWREGANGTSDDRTLRNEFAKFVLSDKVLLESVLRRATSAVTVSCQAIRKRLGERQLNPCFLPQLAFHRDLVITTTPEFRPTTKNFIDATANHALSFEKSIVVILAPKVTRKTREATLARCHERGLCVAIVDDLDLIRLTRSGSEGQPTGPIGLLEVVFEQQPLVSVNPFELQEGQHAKMEMYVGRRQEADELAHSDRYSRLFSGRKLGKSALLKFVEETWSGRALPSGQTLRVLYVPLAGIATEHAAVREIHSALLRSAGVSVAPLPTTGSAAENLTTFLMSYIDSSPTENLLVVLDEADVFVEAQLESYDAGAREQCLTFVMRSRIRARTDGSGAPRIRFIFSGYRATNTSGGSWANWGDVRLLKPLTQEDAVRLVAGPLARVGVDVSAHASSIAFRCGYQPAVLLRYGERLIRTLEENHVATYPRHIVVSAAEVAAVFGDAMVEAEVRTVVWNNFQGNETGQVIFRALLLEFVDVPPGAAISNAVNRVYRRLSELVPDTAWLEASESLAHQQIQSHFDAFVDRSLLTRSKKGSDAQYALRFPHLLPTLVHADLNGPILREIESLRSRHDRASEGRWASLLNATGHSDSALVLRGELGTDALLTIGMHWPEAAADPRAGIPDRLGFHPDNVVTADDPGVAERVESGERLAVVSAGPATLSRLLGCRRTTPVVLVGGIDLLREARSLQAGEVVASGRLSRHQVWWWFARVRCFEFPAPDSLDVFYRQTAGIPILVRSLDELLQKTAQTDTAATFSPAMYARATRDIGGIYPEAARLLLEGPPSLQLKEREVQVLFMLRALVKTGLGLKDSEEFSVAVTEMLEDVRVSFPTFMATARAIDREDDPILRSLMDVGLLEESVGNGGRSPLYSMVPPTPEDPLLRLLEAIERLKVA